MRDTDSTKKVHVRKKLKSIWVFVSEESKQNLGLGSKLVKA